jgi:hypothetical protein
MVTTKHKVIDKTPCTTTHQFIKDSPCKPKDEYMILGTIHPHKVDEFEIPFFYGNKNSLWKILSAAFPNNKYPKIKFNIGNEVEKVKNINETLGTYNIFITDTLKTCERPDIKTTNDKDLIITEKDYNKTQIEEALKNSEIDTIFFTSAFGKNNAAKLFIDMFGIKESSIRVSDNEFTFTIPEIAEKEIRGIVLFSPSNVACIGISKSQEYLAVKDKYTNGIHKSNTPVKKFRIDFYEEKFKKVFG